MTDLIGFDGWIDAEDKARQPGGHPVTSLSVIHWGQFSGTVAGLKRALGPLIETSFHDLGTITKRPALLPRRVKAQLVSSLREGPWFKSGVWSRAVQDHALEAGWISPDRPTLFLQTLAAPVLEPPFRYAVYTDRVAREGAAVGGPHRSSWGRDWIERETAFLQGADRLLVMGPSTVPFLVEDYGVAEDRIEVVGAGPGSPLHDVARATRDPRRLLFVGTDWELKGGPEVLEAFADVRTRHPQLELVLAGACPTGTMPPGVDAMGRVPRAEMGALMASSDLFVVPTHVEAFGYSLTEALMHGLPVVASAVGNQGWLVHDAGVTVEAGHVPGIVAGIERVLADYPAFKARAVARADHLRTTMSWDRVASRIVEGLTTIGPQGTGED